MTKQLKRFDAALVEYHLKLDRGLEVDRERFIAEHPSAAEELRGHFADIEAISGFAWPNQPDLSRVTQVSPPKRLGDYELLEEVGRGGMGSVYRAKQLKLQRTVALKLLRPEKLLSEDSRQRLEVEAKAAARLEHPGIARVFDFGTADGWSFISMEYVPGKSLMELVRESPLPARAAAKYAAQIAEAVEYAHAKSVLHRDLKPSNVLLAADRRAVVSDFGLAKQLDVPEAMTVTGAVVGTPSYMSPEQASGTSGVIGKASDVYSIGATLYELMTGRPPFRAETAVETLRQVLDTEPVNPRRLNSTIPTDLETICLKCLQKDPAARYASAGELAEDLRRFLAGLPVVARSIGVHAKLYRLAKRHPVTAANAAGLIVSIVVGFVLVAYWAGVASWQRDRAEDHFQVAVDFVEDYYGLREQDRKLEALPKELLSSAAQHYAELVRRRPDDWELQSALGKAHLRLGAALSDPRSRQAEMETGIEILETVHRSDPTPVHTFELGASLLQLAKLLPLNDAERLALYKRSYDLLSRLASGKGKTLGRYELGLASFNLGHEHCQLGNMEVGLQWLKRAEQICRELLDENPNMTAARSQLAYTLERASDAHKNLGKDPELAFGCAKEAVALRESLAKSELSDEATADLATAYHRLSLVAPSEAEELASYVNAENILKELLKKRQARDATVTGIHRMLAMTYNNWSRLRIGQGRLHEALTAARHAKKETELLLSGNGVGAPEMAYILGTSCYNIVSLADELGESVDRVGLLQQSVQSLRAVVRSGAATGQQRLELAASLYTLGKAVAAEKQTEPHKHFVEAAELFATMPSPLNGYNAACCYALAAATDESGNSEYFERMALEHLQHCLAEDADGSLAPQARQDEDLATLWQRTSLEQLLATAAAKPGAH